MSFPRSGRGMTPQRGNRSPAARSFEKSLASWYPLNPTTRMSVPSFAGLDHVDLHPFPFAPLIFLLLRPGRPLRGKFAAL